MYLGVERRYESLEHHNISSRRLSRRVPARCSRASAADRADYYLAVNSRIDPRTHRMAATTGLCWSTRRRWIGVSGELAEIRVPTARASCGLETRFGLDGLASHIRVKRFFTPADFETRYLAEGGAFTVSPRTAGFSPSAAHRCNARAGISILSAVRRIPRWLAAGCLSGKMVAGRILRKLALPSRDA